MGRMQTASSTLSSATLSSRGDAFKKVSSDCQYTELLFHQDCEEVQSPHLQRSGGKQRLS